MKVFVQPEKDSLEAIATECFSSRSVRTRNKVFGAASVEFHIVEFVDAEQVGPAFAAMGSGRTPPRATCRLKPEKSVAQRCHRRHITFHPSRR